MVQIYDQSPQGNNLGLGPGGGAAHNPDSGVNASQHRVMVGGHPVYAAYFVGGQGYRNDTTTGIAVGDEAETLYMVVAGGESRMWLLDWEPS